MTSLNRHQPDRPRRVENIPLNYRTLPVIGDNFKVTDAKTMITAARLYRAVRRGDIPNFVAVSDLHEFLFKDQLYDISKKTMGSVIIRTVRYNPRKLLGISKKNEKPRVIYAFNHMLELQYGLEWMICTWLRKFLNEWLAPKSDNPVLGPDRMSEELDIMVGSDDMDYVELYEKGLWKFYMDEPDWSQIAAGLSEPDWEVVRHQVDRKPLRSYQ